MQPRHILTFSAVLLFALGAAALFAADELSQLVSTRPTPLVEAVVQLVAAGLLALAINNWMSRGARIGGIYGRPLGMANLTLHLIAAISLGRAAASGETAPWVIVIAIVFAALCAAFGWLVFIRDPLAAEPGATQP